MNDMKTLNQRYETLAWGALLLVLGSVNLIPGVPAGTGMLGIGVVLLGVNLARLMSKIPVNVFSLTVGVAASVLGAIVLLRPVLNIPPIELPLFPILLVLGGLYLLFHAPRRMGNA